MAALKELRPLARMMEDKGIDLICASLDLFAAAIPLLLYILLPVIGFFMSFCWDCGLCDENPKETKKVTAEFADYLKK